MKLSKTKSEIIRRRASKHIGTPFTLKGCVQDKHDRDYILARGTILHHDEIAHVEVTFDKEEMNPQYWHITDESVNMPVAEAGVIELEDEVVVSDPCYRRDLWCCEMLDNVAPGLWRVEVCVDAIDSFGERVYIVEAVHMDHLTKEDLNWKPAATLGVDSGSMSIFNSGYYRIKDGSGDLFEADQQAAEAFSEDTWNLRNTQRYGIYQIDGKNVGFVCESGCGDGTYPLLTASEDGKIIGIRVEF